MILVIGGAGQGKRDYAQEKFSVSRWLEGDRCREEEVLSAQGICHFELLVKRMMEKQEDPMIFAEKLVKSNKDIIILSDEIGCGLVPVDDFMRRYREEQGRVCTYLATNAKEVHRVFCGIGRVIKG